MARILIAEEVLEAGQGVRPLLGREGHEVRSAGQVEEILEAALRWRPQVVVLDLASLDGAALELVDRLLGLEPRPSLIGVLTESGVPQALATLYRGAFDYLLHPVEGPELAELVRCAVGQQTADVALLRQELEERYGFPEIIGVSPKIQALFRVLAKVAPVDVTVLATGESGTGKELVARAIHRQSARAQGPFVAVNCSAIPESLIEAEFFGHEKGAFTDAQVSRPGRFEQAKGGILFLDEVCDLSLAAQAKLLRALQERQIVRIGGHEPKRVDVRVVAATNKDPEQAMRSGSFREDLYWRLNVVSVRLPPLRERRQDLPLLIDHFLAKFNRELGLKVHAITDEARQLLLDSSWPGNIRELENTLCQAMILAEGKSLTARDLPPRLTGEAPDGKGHLPADLSHLTLAEALGTVTAQLEKQLIVNRLAEHRGHRTTTAQSLGISRKTLFNKMRQHAIGVEDREPDVLS